MKIIKKFVGIILIVVTVFSFAACEGRTGGGTFSYEELMQKFEGEIESNAVIRVLDNQMSVETGHLVEIMKAFNEKYKKYNVKAVDANMDQYIDLEKNGPDGYGPDVLHQANDMIMRYAQNQHVLPLPMDKFQGVDKIPEAVLKTYVKKTYDMDLSYGMPLALQSTVLTYRKDLLPADWKTNWDKNSNEVPDMVENYNDLYKYSLQVKESSGGKKYGLYMSTIDQFFNTGYPISYGAYIFGENSDDIGLAADGAEKGMSLHRELAGVLGAECISQDPTTQVATYIADSKGTVFATIGTPDWLTTFSKELAKTYRAQGKTADEAKILAEQNLVVVSPPALPKDGNIKKDITDMANETFAATTMGGVNAFAISSYTQYPKASLAFVQFVSEYEQIKLRSAALGAVPVRTDIADEIKGVSKMLNDRINAGNIYMMPSTRDTMYIWPPLESIFNDFATDNTTRKNPIYTTPTAVKQALANLVKDIKTAMELGKK